VSHLVLVDTGADGLDPKTGRLLFGYYESLEGQVSYNHIPPCLSDALVSVIIANRDSVVSKK
jgi:hypothetical protein